MLQSQSPGQGNDGDMHPGSAPGRPRAQTPPPTTGCVSPVSERASSSKHGEQAASVCQTTWHILSIASNKMKNASSLRHAVCYHAEFALFRFVARRVLWPPGVSTLLEELKESSERIVDRGPLSSIQPNALRSAGQACGPGTGWTLKCNSSFDWRNSSGCIHKHIIRICIGIGIPV